MTPAQYLSPGKRIVQAGEVLRICEVEKKSDAVRITVESADNPFPGEQSYLYVHKDLEFEERS